MKKEEIERNQIPVCWKCECDSNEELNSKQKRKITEDFKGSLNPLYI